MERSSAVSIVDLIESANLLLGSDGRREIVVIIFHPLSFSSHSELRINIQPKIIMSLNKQQSPIMATSAAAAPGLLQQVGMAGGAAVITVSFIHPIDVVKVCYYLIFLLLHISCSN